MDYKVDILVLSVHPDDAELGCSGTIAKHIALGKTVAIVDFTAGELGTRGTPEIRINEAEIAARIMGLTHRENLFMKDGFSRNDEEHQLQLIKAIRKYQPEIVLANSPEDRHPDHGRAAQLALDACFYSGLRKIETTYQGHTQKEWRPKAVFHYIQDRYIEPDFVVDISSYIETKKEAIMAFKSQFFDPSNTEPTSYISTPEFFEFVLARSSEMGHKIGVRYGEGFIKSKMLQVNSLFEVL
jgi:N-acetylglucosamine malate deacetylase 1